MAVVLVIAVGSSVTAAGPAAAAFTVTAPRPPWTAARGPDPGGHPNRLAGVSCTSATTCVDVGSEVVGGGTEALIETLARGTWTVTPGPSPAGDSALHGVSCVSPVACVAVGVSGRGARARALVETMVGSTWSVTPTPPTGPGASTLDGVSCTQEGGAMTCDAVGHLGTPGQTQPLVMTTGGGPWRLVPTPAVAGGSGILEAVSCTAATACTAVGHDEVSGVPEALAESRSGVGWSVTSVTGPADGSSLSGVSCLSPTDCVAVGDVVPGSGTPRSLVESWDGTTWSTAPSPDPGRRGNPLAGISCPTATDCVAGGSTSNGPGDRALVLSWTGRSWSVTPDADPGTPAGALTAVSCVSIDSCRAVGATSTGDGPDRALVLSFEVPPPVIDKVSFRVGSTRPRITITGHGFGSEPVGSATGCGTTGTDFPGADLSFQDVQTGWSAGTPGDCLGLVVSSYTATRISYSFGSAYGTGDPPLELSTSDAFTVSVDGATCSEIVPKPSSVSRPPAPGSGGPPVRVVTLAAGPAPMSSSTSCT